MVTDEDFTMTSDEAFSFLVDVLRMTSPKVKLETNRIAFLDDLHRAMHHHIPFQTVRSVSTPHPDRCLPTPDEIKRDVFTKIGGRCYVQNMFGFMLLRALGFRVSLVPSDARGMSDAHIVLLVRDAALEGSKHLVDFGAGYPTFHAISLDFEHTSPEYKDSYLRYRFLREGNVIIRQHTPGTDITRTRRFAKDGTADDWFSVFFIYVDKPVDVSYFTNTITPIYTDLSSVFSFLVSLSCFAFPKGHLVCIKNTTLLLENTDGVVVKSYLKSRGEILSIFERYFPQFPEEMIEKAMDEENIKLDFNKSVES